MSGFFEAFARRIAERSSDRRGVDADRGADVTVSGSFSIGVGAARRPVTSGRRAGAEGCNCLGVRKKVSRVR
jgi:hypothetical protein